MMAVARIRKRYQIWSSRSKYPPREQHRAINNFVSTNHRGTDFQVIVTDLDLVSFGILNSHFDLVTTGTGQLEVADKTLTLPLSIPGEMVLIVIAIDLNGVVFRRDNDRHLCLVKHLDETG
jgi:hypothetical protein